MQMWFPIERFIFSTRNSYYNVTEQIKAKHIPFQRLAIGIIQPSRLCRRLNLIPKQIHLYTCSVDILYSQLNPNIRYSYILSNISLIFHNFLPYKRFSQSYCYLKPHWTILSFWLFLATMYMIFHLFTFIYPIWREITVTLHCPFLLLQLLIRPGHS